MVTSCLFVSELEHYNEIQTIGGDDEGDNDILSHICLLITYHDMLLLI